MRPLEGITILDLTRLLPGAVATLILQRAGAIVLKIEPPGTGDPARNIPSVFQATNAGKKNITLNLKDPVDREKLLCLSEAADVLVEGNRPGVMERLDLDFNVLEQRNPRLIYATLTGYPREGPDASRAGHDLNYLAMAGVLTPPYIPTVQIADIAGGSLPLVQNILLALLERHRTGRGSRVDINMTDGLDPLLILPKAYALDGKPSPLTGRYPCYNLYRCSCGAWIAVGALELKFWRNLCNTISRPDLIDRQFSEAALDEVRSVFASRPASHWLALTEALDCCVTPVRDLVPSPATPF